MFDTVIVVDWSGGNDRGATPKADAIWACVVRGGVTETPVYLRNRQVAEAWIADTLQIERAAGRRVMVGFDFPFGYPRGFARAVAGTDDPLALWDWLAERIEDAPKANNRFDVAGAINVVLGGNGPPRRGTKTPLPSGGRPKSAQRAHSLSGSLAGQGRLGRRR